jgi:outer membrane protein OmpA-like peptidoglycan-associated protein
VTYHTLSAKRGDGLSLGLNGRAGPLVFGTNNLKPLFSGDIASINFFAFLRVPVPYRTITDRDGDGVKDASDLCQDVAGEIALQGCPDADHDQIPDGSDACPHQAGLAQFKGCPDTDADGIRDADDACPFDKGELYLKGCPDTDRDSITDKQDECPYEAGLKRFRGCPDKDGDGIPDRSDLCPEAKGPLKSSGCPDTDRDGLHDGIDQCPPIAGPLDNKGCPWPDADNDKVPDREDSCKYTAGVIPLHGCPEPVPLAPAQKKVLEKAYRSLEFETGKDVIKPVSFPSLRALAKLMKGHELDWKLKLSGHTDNAGTEAGNLLLSEQRARAVEQFLIKEGIPSYAILVEWHGQYSPIADNATAAGRKKNRRVEMTLLMVAQ